MCAVFKFRYKSHKSKKLSTNAGVFSVSDGGQGSNRPRPEAYWSDLTSDPRSVFSSNQEPTPFINVDKSGSLSDVLFREVCSK
jgi:hypothetical protein